MAFQLPKIDFSDAKTRVIIIFGGVVGFIITVYLIVHFFAGGATTAGASKVAGAPGDLQSVPGGQLTPEYYRALVQANTQAAKQAKISGGSAVPTLLNEPGAQPAFEQTATPSCTVVCPSDEDTTVDNEVNDLVKAGKISAEEGKKLVELARSNIAVSEYGAQLNNLVKQGKLSPDQARKLLDDYKKQHDSALIQQSGKVMDSLIKSGQLPVDAANELLEAQKKHVSPAEYAEKLASLAQQGKITPAVAAQLLAQYTEQQAKEAENEAVGQLAEMAATGQIAPEVAKELQDYVKRHVSPKEYEEELQHLVTQGKLTKEQAQRLSNQYKQLVPPQVAEQLAEAQKRNVPVSEYQDRLQRLVAEGKISPEKAQQLLAEYQALKGGGPAGTMDEVVKQVEKLNEDAVKQLARSGKISADTEQKLLALVQAKVPPEVYKQQLDELVKAGKISVEDAQNLMNTYQQQKGREGVQALVAGKIAPEMERQLIEMQKTNAPIADYKKQLDSLVQQGKISPQEAQQLLQHYAKLQEVRAQANRLSAQRASNIPLEEYANELRRAVAAGTVTPEQAANLLKEYQESKRVVATVPTVAVPNVQGAEAFAQLQQRVQAAAPAATPAPVPPVSREQFSAAAGKARVEAEKAELERIQTLMNGMSTQAGQLIASWQPPKMAGVAGSGGEDKKTATTTTTATTTSTTTATGTATDTNTPTGPPLIKAGTILFAVLDTAVNSDYPDTPVMATIVDGKLKGAKLLGKLAIGKAQDRMSLTFSLMNMEEWTSGKAVNAFAIDPDTARTALASSVNYHYFMRYGGMFASSFLQGYATAIMNSGSTTSSGIFGTTTTNPTLSPANKIMTGLGQVGTTLGTAIQDNINIPPTVKIDPGVSLGILFMQDVT